MKKTEICLYCGGDYLPKRRGAQKFCSNSCRSLNWKNKQPKEEVKPTAVIPKNVKPLAQNKPDQRDRISVAGVGNAAIGAGLFEFGKEILTPQQNKAATKKDIQDLKVFFRSRYLLVHNLRKDPNGRTPYYDVRTGNLVYL
ncbi:hypothetical protein ACNR9Q_00365 [Maribacter sp. X9]|uniref:hypothetical protein n=1 Tax=Maribacter sp. X9 TaxID=3402159 RepID=UPI003AF33556